MSYWIGRIEPSMWFEGEWWQEILPDDVRLAILSLGVQRLAAEDLERAHSQILEKVEMLEREGVDVINVGGSPVVTAYGPAGHARLIEEIGQRVTRPFVTSLQAEVEALNQVGAKNVLIASPYPIAQTEKRVKVLQDEGFSVAAHDSLDIERTREITMLDPDRVVEQALRLAEAHPEGDVLYMPCGSLPVVRRIAEIEAESGLPVVTNVQAQATACLRRIKYPGVVTGYGRLMERLEPVA